MDPFQAEKLDQIIALLKKIEKHLEHPLYVINNPAPVLAPVARPTDPQHQPWCQIVEAMRGWWSITPPQCTCGVVSFPIGTITTTGTTSALEFDAGNSSSQEDQ